MLSNFVALSEPIDDIKKTGVIPGLSYLNKRADGNLPILYGIFISGNLKKAIFYSLKEKKRIKVAEGENIDGYKVEKILEGVVILSDGSDTYKLKPFSKYAIKKRKEFSKVRIASLSESKVIYSKDDTIKGALSDNKKSDRVINTSNAEKSVKTNQSSSEVGKKGTRALPPRGLFPFTARKRGNVGNPFIKLLRRIERH